jgi:predicted small lipoprotein YifL
MKPLIVLIAAALMLSGCGRKGPLEPRPQLTMAERQG